MTGSTGRAGGASIEFRGVAKRYGATVALADLDLRIEPGEFVSLLGPSGSGKTTTLNILAGLLAADAGRVLIGDRDVTALAPEKRDIAMVFQNYALYPHMTVAENLAFPLRAPARRVDPAAIAARVAQAAETLGIAPLLARYPREISGGQQQRVALGRAMIRDPGVFLLDEPLSNLDARLRLRMRHDLKALHQRLRSTVVYVTHDQSEAMSLSDRIAIYHAGRLQQFAAPIDIYRRPVNLFVANFMGEREMNTVEGDVIEADGAIRLAAGGASLRLGDADSAWRRLAGRRVVFGIRPEGVTIVGHGSGDAAPLAGRLRVVEHAGAEQVFFAETPLGEFCGRAAADAGLQVGDAVALDLAAGERFVFDAASGRAEVHGGRPGSGPPAAARS